MKKVTSLDKLQAAAERYTPDSAFLRSLATTARTEVDHLRSLKAKGMSDEHIAEQTTAAKLKLSNAISAQEAAVRATYDVAVTQARLKYVAENSTTQKISEMGLLRDRVAAAGDQTLLYMIKNGDKTPEQLTMIGAECRRRGMDEAANQISVSVNLAADPWMSDPTIAATEDRIGEWNSSRALGGARIAAGLGNESQKFVPLGDGFVSVDSLLGDE